MEVHMKKILAILLAFSLALALTACASDSGTSTADPAGTSSAAEPVSSEEERVPISPAVPYVDGDDYYDFDCSKDLDEKGYYASFNAADHVKLPENLTVSIPYDIHTPSQDKIDESINKVIDFYATDEQIMNRAVADGDTINIDYVGKLDGVEFQGGSTGGYGTDVTVGVTNYVDNFLQKLIGHMPGETFDIDITFPADYGNASLAGKATVFTVTINYIVGDKIMPELTDEFVANNLQSTYGWSTVEEMTRTLTEDLQTEAVNDYLYDYLIGNSQVETVPQEIIDYMTNYFIYYHSYLAKGNEITIPVLLANFGFESMTDMLTDYKQDIADACEEEMIIQAASKELKVDLTKEDLEAYFMAELGRTDYSIYETNFGLPYVKKMVLSWKVLELMKEQANYLPQ